MYAIVVYFLARIHVNNIWIHNQIRKIIKELSKQANNWNLRANKIYITKTRVVVVLRYILLETIHALANGLFIMRLLLPHPQAGLSLLGSKEGIKFFKCA